MIEPDGNSAWSDEHGHSLLHRDRTGVIDFVPFAAQQFDHEETKRGTIQMVFKKFFEMFSRHDSVP